MGALYFLWNDDIFQFTIFFWVTKFDDFFDHCRDISFLISIVLLCCFKYSIIFFVIFIFVITGALVGVHVGYSQKEYSNINDTKELLDALQIFCLHPKLGKVCHVYDVELYMVTINLLIILCYK